MKLDISFCLNDNQSNRVYLFRKIQANNIYALTSEWIYVIKEVFSHFSACNYSTEAIYDSKKLLARGYEIKLTPRKKPILTVEYFPTNKKITIRFFKRIFLILTPKELCACSTDDLLFCIRYAMVYHDAYTPITSICFCRKESENSYFGIMDDCQFNELSPFFESYQNNYCQFMKNLPTEKSFPPKYIYDAFDHIAYGNYSLTKSMSLLLQCNCLYTGIEPTRYESLIECPADAFLVISHDNLTEHMEFAYKQKTKKGPVITSTELSCYMELTDKISVISQFEEYYAAWLAQLDYSVGNNIKQYLEDISSNVTLFNILVFNQTMTLENTLMEEEFARKHL